MFGQLFAGCRMGFALVLELTAAPVQAVAQVAEFLVELGRLLGGSEGGGLVGGGPLLQAGQFAGEAAQLLAGGRVGRAFGGEVDGAGAVVGFEAIEAVLGRAVELLFVGQFAAAGLDIADGLVGAANLPGGFAAEFGLFGLEVGDAALQQVVGLPGFGVATGLGIAVAATLAERLAGAGQLGLGVGPSLALGIQFAVGSGHLLLEVNDRVGRIHVGVVGHGPGIVT